MVERESSGGREEMSGLRGEGGEEHGLRGICPPCFPPISSPS